MVKIKLPDDYKEEIFIEGWLSGQLKKGIYPNYKIENNGLPETTGKRIRVKSSFYIAYERQKN